MVWLFGATLFLSAFLLFTVELIVAKAVLPTFGGVPMVWNTCMAFFQAALLAGYFYGHGAISWMGTRRHSIVYAVLVAAPLLILPFPTQVHEPPAAIDNPIGRLVILLVGWIGLPFFVLSTSAAVLQKGFSTINARRSADPYFLYAASNAGSLLALVSYPTLIERLLPLREQSRIWAVCYVAFVAGAWACAAVTLRNKIRALEDTRRKTDDDSLSFAHAPRIDVSRRARWVALSFVPSSLMLAVTTYLSTDIAAVPLLWTIPLSLYLLTFVLAFGSRSKSITAVADRALPLLAIPLTLFMVVALRIPLWLAIPVHLLAFTAAALLCHGQLADDRPSPDSLTEFYFYIALGGMLGGLFNTLAAPVLFNSVVEYPLVLVLACLLRLGAPEGMPRRAMDLAVPVAIGILTAAVMLGLDALGMAGLTFVGLSAPAFLAFSQSRRYPVRFALCLAAILVAGAMVRRSADGPLLTERTFYGVYRVLLEYSGQYRGLVNGTTLHGMQAVDPVRRGEPLTYYHRSGPFGDAAAAIPVMSKPVNVAAVGLGIGSLAAYARPDQRWTFFEIDPAVERLARTDRYFTYLEDCGAKCRVVLGDARISLTREPPAQYGVIVLDAFSSDAIPIHLLTDEAFALYLSRLADGGVLLVHVSNRHLDLSPIVARLIARHGLMARERVDRQVSQDEQRRLGRTASQWVVMARRESDLGALVMNPAWTVPVASPSTPLWTDDWSSILSVLRLR